MNATAEMTAAGAASANAPARNNIVMDCQIDKVFYGDFLAVRASTVPIEKNKITGFIGPSGCGKSTVLRSLNRMNDLIPIFRFEGKVTYHGQDIYDRKVDPVVVRRYIGMVFQQPNPFAMSIYDNVAFGLRLNGFKGNMDERVEKALKGAALLERGQGQAEKQRIVAVRRSATAAVHRPRHRHRTRCAADGRTLFGAGPDCDPTGRGTDART
jgi:phosphate transport system ATP-binding protein